MKPLLDKILLLVVLAALAGCGKSPDASRDPAAGEVLTVLRAQTDALNRKDATAYLATIDPESPAYGGPRTPSSRCFKSTSCATR